MIKPNCKILAQRLRKLRINADLKQNAMAHILNMNSQQDYSKLENGKKNFDGELILKICSYFKINLEDFLSDENCQTEFKTKSSLKEKEEENQLLREIYKLNQEINKYKKVEELLIEKIWIEKELNFISQKIHFLTKRDFHFLKNQNK